MSVYYNFFYIDLVKEQNPMDDCYGVEMYVLENRPSYEEINNPVLFNCRNNYFVDECFTQAFEKGGNEVPFLKNLKLIFGNMFWTGNFKPDNENTTFFMNEWNLPWQEHMNIKGRFYLDFYAISNQHIAKVLEGLQPSDLAPYFDYVSDLLKLDESEDRNHRDIINEWVKMYEVALEKKKGLVYDIG